MKSIRSSKDLEKKIASLESKRMDSEIRLEERWEEVKESLKPVNIVKRSLKEMISGTKTNSNLFGSIAALTAGLLARRLIMGRSPNGFRKWLGSMLQVGISSVVAKKPAAEKSRSFLTRLFSKKKKPALQSG